MKKTVLILCSLFLCMHLYCVDGEVNYSPLTFYKSVYLTTGILQDQVKIQFSFKWEVLQRIGFYAAYSQLMMWNLYDPSSPFKDINFNPDLFWRFESGYNFLGDVRIPGVDYIQLGFFEHNSNGKVAPDSRGYNRFYVQAQFGIGEELHAALNIKWFMLYDPLLNLPLFKIDNPDIQDYIGCFEFLVFLRLRDVARNIDSEEIYVRFAPGGGVLGLDFTKGYQEIGLLTRSFISRFRVYIQLYHGYAECLIDYSNAAAWDRFAIRAGVMFQ
jgi:phospholipase A1